MQEPEWWEDTEDMADDALVWDFATHKYVYRPEADKEGEAS